VWIDTDHSDAYRISYKSEHELEVEQQPFRGCCICIWDVFCIRGMSGCEDFINPFFFLAPCCLVYKNACTKKGETLSLLKFTANPVNGSVTCCEVRKIPFGEDDDRSYETTIYDVDTVTHSTFKSKIKGWTGSHDTSGYQAHKGHAEANTRKMTQLVVKGQLLENSQFYVEEYSKPASIILPMYEYGYTTYARQTKVVAERVTHWMAPFKAISDKSHGTATSSVSVVVAD